MSVPLDRHVGLVTDGQADPVTLLEGQAATQVAELVPIRYGVERDFYLCRLRDGKGSVVVEEIVPDGSAFYTRTCGQTLARAHAGRLVAQSGL